MQKEIDVETKKKIPSVVARGSVISSNHVSIDIHFYSLLCNYFKGLSMISLGDTLDHYRYS